MISRITIAILALALCGSLMWGVWTSWDVRDLERENIALKLSRDGCQDSLSNIVRDRIRDETTTDPNFTVPSRWLMPAPATGSDPE